MKPTTASDVKTEIASPLDPSLPKKVQREARKEVKYQQHEATSYAYKIVSIDPNFQAPLKMYTGVDALSHFLHELMKDSDNIFKEYIKKPKEMLFTSVNKHEFDNVTECHICNEAFKDGEEKVRYHYHIMGTFRGAAHNRCNLNYKINARRWKLPVFFHNLRGYDGHILINAPNRTLRNIRIIPNNMKKYMAFSIDQLQFLDSFQFTMQSLESLVNIMGNEYLYYTI